MNRYELLEPLGDGSFGEVTKARSLKTNEVVAIKKMKALFPSWEECLQLRELKSLRVLRHENVVQLKEVIRDKEELYFVFEYMQSSLHKVLRHHHRQAQAAQAAQVPSASPAATTAVDDAMTTAMPVGWLSEAQIKSIMYQLFSGLAYMHKHGFFHRDIKPENLLCHDETLKIADLGQAREIRSRPPFTDYVSTRWYRSPELLLRSTTYNSPIDLWACGCILAELYLQAPLFAGTSEADQLCRIAKVLGSPTRENWPEAVTTTAQMQFKFPKSAPVAWKLVLPPYASKAAVQLVSELLQYDPSRRLTAAQALQHRFFDQQVPRPVSLTTLLPATATAASVAPLPLPLKAEQKGGGGSNANWAEATPAASTSRWWRESASALPTVASHSDVLLASSRKNYETSGMAATRDKLDPRADAKTLQGGGGGLGGGPGGGGGGGGSKASSSSYGGSNEVSSSSASWLSARKWTSPEMDDDEPTDRDRDRDRDHYADDKQHVATTRDEKKKPPRENDADDKSEWKRAPRHPPTLQQQQHQQRRRSSSHLSFRSQDHMLQDLLDEFLA